MQQRAQHEQEELLAADFLSTCGHENSDLRVEEVEKAISMLNGNSAPSPDEQVFNIHVMLKERRGFG